MRRADRLFQIIQLLRQRRVVTATVLAERLEVSERTIYRDVRDLIATGTPIEAEAGVGYRLGASYDLPPLMFDEEEVRALVLGARMVASNADKGLARASRSVLSKVRDALPKRLRPLLRDTALYAPDGSIGRGLSTRLGQVRSATESRHKLSLEYVSADGTKTARVVRPLSLAFWGRTWTLTAWCELRESFRTFRVDRIAQVEMSGESFEPEPGKTLEDYLRLIGMDPSTILG